MSFVVFHYVHILSVVCYGIRIRKLHAKVRWDLQCNFICNLVIKNLHRKLSESKIVIFCFFIVGTKWNGHIPGSQDSQSKDISLFACKRKEKKYKKIEEIASIGYHFQPTFMKTTNNVILIIDRLKNVFFFLNKNQILKVYTWPY